MPFHVVCLCGREFTVDDALEGKRGRCPECGWILRLRRPGNKSEESGPAATATRPSSEPSEPTEFVPTPVETSYELLPVAAPSRIPILTPGFLYDPNEDNTETAPESVAPTVVGWRIPWMMSLAAIGGIAFGGTAALVIWAIQSNPRDDRPASSTKSSDVEVAAIAPEPIKADAAPVPNDLVKAAQALLADARAVINPSEQEVESGPIDTPDVPAVELSHPQTVVEDGSETATAHPVALEDLVSRVEISVARIEGLMGGGTGFMGLPKMVVTNAHVVSGEPIDRLEVTFPSARKPEQRGPYPVRLTHFDDERDLAFLELQNEPPPSGFPPPLPIADRDVFRRGREVLLIGSPAVGGELTLENAVTQGVLSTITKLDGRTYYQLGASINPGNSGGPVLDRQGRVVGVATARAADEEALGFAIPAEELLAALEPYRRPRSVEEAESLRHEAEARHQVTLGGPEAALGRLLASAEPPRQLAILEAGEDVPSDDPRVRQIEALLDRIQTGFGEPNVKRIVAITATIARVLQEAPGRDRTPIRVILTSFARIADSQAQAITRDPTRPRIEFQQAAALYLALRTEARSSDARATDLIVSRIADGTLFERPRAMPGDFPTPDPTLVGEIGPFGPILEGVTTREFHYRREATTPPRYGETPGSVHILRNARVRVQQVRIETGDVKYLVTTLDRKTLLVGEAFFAKNFRILR